jgi:hypothetical protein
LELFAQDKLVPSGAAQVERAKRFYHATEAESSLAFVTRLLDTFRQNPARVYFETHTSRT